MTTELKEKFEKFIEEEGGRKEIKKKQKMGEKEIRKYRNYLKRNIWKSDEEKEKIGFWKDLDRYYIPACCICFYSLGHDVNGDKDGHLFYSFTEEEIDELIKEGLIECRQIDEGYIPPYEGTFVYCLV